MWRKIASMWFLGALAVVLVVGIAAPEVARPLTDRIPRNWLVALILLLTALPMNARVALGSRAAWLAVGVAMLLSTVAAPLLGGVAGWWLPPALAIGMVVATASPCTVASAAVWTRRGGGNDAVAIVVTILTSLACFIVLPFWAAMLLGSTTEVSVGRLVTTLLACVVAPVIVGQLIRLAPPAAAWTTRHKKALSLSAQFGVLLMAFIGAVDAGVEIHSRSDVPTAGDWARVILAAVVVHTLLLAAGWWGGRAVRLPRAEALAAAIAGSQKTLAVGVGIALEFGGLAIFPMIAYHAVQLMIDTLFVDWVRE